jgi:hypothetical protein
MDDQCRAYQLQITFDDGLPGESLHVQRANPWRWRQLGTLSGAQSNEQLDGKTSKVHPNSEPLPWPVSPILS